MDASDLKKKIKDGTPNRRKTVRHVAGYGAIGRRSILLDKPRKSAGNGLLIGGGSFGVAEGKMALESWEVFGKFFTPKGSFSIDNYQK